MGEMFIIEWTTLASYLLRQFVTIETPAGSYFGEVVVVEYTPKRPGKVGVVLDNPSRVRRAA
jgi:hypothetical protein